MKPIPHQPHTAFTLIELLVVIATVGLLGTLVAATVQPGTDNELEKRNRLHCVNNQRQIGTAYRVFGSDNGDLYPLEATDNSYIHQPGGVGKTPGAVVSTAAQPWQVFQAMWNEILTPKVLLCPSDRARATYSRTSNFNALAGAPGASTTNSLGHADNRNQAVSYTALADANETRPSQVLTTDRNLNSATTNTAATTLPLPSGTRYTVASDATANSMFWVGSSNGGFHGLEGNLTLADGSVQPVTAAKLQRFLVESGSAYRWGTPDRPAHGDSIFLLP